MHLQLEGLRRGRPGPRVSVRGHVRIARVTRASGHLKRPIERRSAPRIAELPGAVLRGEAMDRLQLVTGQEALE